MKRTRIKYLWYLKYLNEMQDTKLFKMYHSNNEKNRFIFQLTTVKIKVLYRMYGNYKYPIKCSLHRQKEQIEIKFVCRTVLVF